MLCYLSYYNIIMTNFDYYNFRINMVTEKINEEIKFYLECEYHDTIPIQKYITYLKDRLGMNRQENIPITCYDKSGNKYEMKKMNLDEYTKDMDIYVFKKPWNKLREFHKKMKIKEYIDNLEYHANTDIEQVKKNRQYLINALIGGLKTKRFIKNKDEILYDSEQMKIISVSCLIISKKTKLYHIMWK
jgi:hypothetical protein